MVQVDPCKPKESATKMPKSVWFLTKMKNNCYIMICKTMIILINRLKPKISYKKPANGLTPPNKRLFAPPKTTER